MCLDSPASPPPFYCELIQDTKLVPVVRAWKFIPMDIDPPADIAFDIIKYTQLEAFNKDPRINKTEKRFSGSTNEIGTILETKVLEQQGISPQEASPSNITSVIPKSADLRTKDSRMQQPQQANGMSPTMFPSGSMPPAGYLGQNMGYGIDPNVMPENYQDYGAPAK